MVGGLWDWRGWRDWRDWRDEGLVGLEGLDGIGGLGDWRGLEGPGSLGAWGPGSLDAWGPGPGGLGADMRGANGPRHPLVFLQLG